jgi:hypothetical protein
MITRFLLPYFPLPREKGVSPSLREASPSPSKGDGEKAIQPYASLSLDCFASLAMTVADIDFVTPPS